MSNIESEKKLERSLKSAVESKLKGLSLKLLSAHITGLPDRLCLIPGGRLFFAEIKTTNKKPRKIQLFMHRKLRELGFKVEVIETTEQIQNIIRDYE
jgi:hypothetical protein